MPIGSKVLGAKFWEHSEKETKKISCAGNVYDLTRKLNSKIKQTEEIFLKKFGRNENKNPGRLQEFFFILYTFFLYDM